MTIEPNGAHTGASTLTLADGSTVVVAYNVSEMTMRLAASSITPGTRLQSFDLLGATGDSYSIPLDTTSIVSVEAL